MYLSTQNFLPYTYLISWSKELTGLNHDTFYYGCKYGKDANPDLFWKEYFTSSTEVKLFRERYGDPDKIEIRKKFVKLIYSEDSSKYVTKYESKVLRRINAAADPRYLNKSNGVAGFSSAGRITVKTIDNKTLSVEIGNAAFESGNLVGATKGMSIFKDKNGNRIFTNTDDERVISRDLVGVHSGFTVVKDCDGNKFQTRVDDERLLSGELCGHTKGYTMVKDGNGNVFSVSVESFKSTSDLVGVNKGKMTAKDKNGNTFQISRDDLRRKSGELSGNAKGTVKVRNEDNKIITVSVDDPKYLSGEYEFAWKGYIQVYDTISQTKKKIPKDDPRILTGECIITFNKTITLYDKHGTKHKNIEKNDPRYLSGELMHHNKVFCHVYDENGNKLLVLRTDERIQQGIYTRASQNTKSKS